MWISEDDYEKYGMKLAEADEASRIQPGMAVPEGNESCRMYKRQNIHR